MKNFFAALASFCSNSRVLVAAWLRQTLLFRLRCSIRRSSLLLVICRLVLAVVSDTPGRAFADEPATKAGTARAAARRKREVKTPGEEFELVQPRNVTVEETLEDDEGVARQVVADATFDTWLYGARRDPVLLRERLGELLRLKVAAADQLYELTQAQRKKLELAAQRDIERVFDRVARMRERFVLVKDDDAQRRAFYDQEFVPFRDALTLNVYGPESLLSKTLQRGLTPEQAARSAAGAPPASSNLRKIGLALHNYHDVFGRFPAAVMRGPDSQTPYSWRVELLPLLATDFEKQPGGADVLRGKLKGDELRQTWWKMIEAAGYRLDEPWDGERNRVFAKRSPPVYRPDADEPASNHAAFFALTGPNTAFPEGRGMGLKEFTDGPGETLLLVEARRDIPWTKPADIPYEGAATRPLLGASRQSGFLCLTADGAVHAIGSEVPNDEFQALATRRGGDTVSIPGIPWKPERPAVPRAAGTPEPMPEVQPDRVVLGNVRVGATVESSVRVFVPGDNAEGVDVKIDAPPFVKVTRTKVATQMFGNRGSYITCDVWLTLDTSRAGAFDGLLEVHLADRRIQVPVFVDVLVPEAGLTRVLFVETPIERFSSSNSADFEPFLDLVESARLDPHYLEVDRDGPVLRDLDLAQFDVVLLAGSGLFLARADDFRKLTTFIEEGGKVVLAANHFFRGTVGKANELLVPLGLKMHDVEAELIQVEGAAITPHALTRDVRTLRFFRPSPVYVEAQEKGEILVAAPMYPDGGFVAVARAGKGQVVALGASLWWNWIASEREAGADNAVMLRNLLTKP
ncbi:MAG: DUF1559 domain-containing protein [Planctomycetaceae bacterium]|nr:DUF1559 domain-containing protein [Planctomycetaceae bacterium]